MASTITAAARVYLSVDIAVQHYVICMLCLYLYMVIHIIRAFPRDVFVIIRALPRDVCVCVCAVFVIICVLLDFNTIFKDFHQGTLC